MVFATPCSCVNSSPRSIEKSWSRPACSPGIDDSIETEGGTAPFERGLYGCTEMLADGFLDLYRSGILKRRVYPSAKLQRLIDDGHIDERVSLHTLDALVEAGMSRMSFADFQEFREVGLFRDDVEYDRGVLITPDGQQLRATFSDPEQRAQIAQYCLGETLRNGVLADAGFFFGPKSFYSGLRELPAVQRKMFAMRGISFVNELYGHEWELKVRAAPLRALCEHDHDGDRPGRRRVRCAERRSRRQRRRRSI